MTGAIIFLGIIVIGGAAVWIVAFRLGKLTVKTGFDEANVQAAEGIAKAQADAPSTVDDLTQRLRNGGKL